jgi:hypothetical protein
MKINAGTEEIYVWPDGRVVWGNSEVKGPDAMILLLESVFAAGRSDAQADILNALGIVPLDNNGLGRKS